MGSALTVLLSISRYINISLLGTILISTFFNPLNISWEIILGLLIFLCILPGLIYDSQIGTIIGNLTNYYSFTLPPALEVSLVYILFYILYNNIANRTQGSAFLIIILLYTFCVYRSFFPPNDGSADSIAANMYWNKDT